MSIAEWDPASSSLPANAASDTAENESAVNLSAVNESFSQVQRQLHRLSTVRRQQGISLRNVARRLNADISVVRQQEDEASDLPLSVLYEWQKVLQVPVTELLVDCNSPLSPPVMERARMVKVMKTVAAIAEQANTPSLKRLLQMLCDQLLEIMPELTDVAPWHSVGRRRTLEEFGRAVERQMPDNVFRRRAQ